MRHNMHLNLIPFLKIKEGRKTIELRLYDEKRRLISVGDEILFTSLDDANEMVHSKVVAMHVFKSFEQLYSKLPMEKCGYGKSEKADPMDMLKYYSKEEQEKFGVVGIEIEVID